MTYLLTIEVRRGDSGTRDVGEIVALEQAWCDDVYAVLTELREHTGKRLTDRVRWPSDISLERAIESDPRRAGTTELA